MFFISNNLHAEEASFKLGEIIVSGETPRIVESVGTVNEITAEDIKRSGARNLNEAIKLLPGLYVRTGGDGTPRIDIRGLRTRQVTLLLDGVSVNSAIDGQFDPSAIDVTNIESIKVTRGASSVLYGAGGSAGVINIITRAGSGRLNGKAMAEFGQNGTRHGRFSAGGSGENWQAFATASGFHQDSFELSEDYTPVPVTGSPNPNNFQPSGDRINSDRSDSSFYGNFIWRGLERTEIGLSSSYRKGYYGKPSETRDFTGGDADPFARRPRFERVDDYEGFSVNLTASHEFEIPLVIKPMFYFNRLDELTNNYDNANFNSQVINRAFSSDARSDIYGGSILLSYDFTDYGLSSLAADCRREDWSTDGFTIETNANVFTPLSIDQYDTICSAGFEHEVMVLDNLGLTGGIGYAWQSKKSGDNDRGHTYMLGTFYDVLPLTRIHVSHARKIRFPTLRDLFEPGRANPDLTSETTLHYEAGIRQTFTVIPASLGITFFRVDAEDFIETDGSGIAQNIEENRFEGIEISGDITPVRDLVIRVGYTYMESENLSAGITNDDLQNRPQHQLGVDVNYHFPWWDFNIYGSWLHVEGNIELSRGNNPVSHETGDYDVFDLKVEKSFGDISVFGRALNLLDQDYVESGGFPAPGRTVFFGGELRFGS